MREALVLPSRGALKQACRTTVLSDRRLGVNTPSGGIAREEIRSMAKAGRKTHRVGPYTRKDGTKVPAHERRMPRKGC
jgi:hypothetical protein